MRLVSFEIQMKPQLQTGVLLLLCELYLSVDTASAIVASYSYLKACRRCFSRLISLLYFLSEIYCFITSAIYYSLHDIHF